MFIDPLISSVISNVITMRIFTAAALVIFSGFTASIAATPAPELNKRCIAEMDECKILAVNECCDGKICVPSILFFLGIGFCY